MTLTDSYQYIGRSSEVKAYGKDYYYYILLYAKTSGSQYTGKHTVSVKMRLVCTNAATFYGFYTDGSVEVDGASAISWDGQQIPNTTWNSTNLTEGGVTYPRWVDLREGTVVIDTRYAAKTVTVTASWHRNSISSTPPDWLPKTTPATANLTVTLPLIPAASTITSAADVILGKNCAVKWTPMSTAFYYKMGFQLGEWKHSTEVVHPNKTTEYTYSGLMIPSEVAYQIPNAPNGTMHVYLHTFSDSAGTVQIGDTSSATFKVTVPDNEFTKPRVAMELSAVHSLPDKFSGLYIQGHSKVEVTPSAEGQFGADIQSFSMRVGGVSYGEAENYTSDYFSTYGTFNVACYATDSRGYIGETSRDINVIAYRNPKLENVSATRCDANGNESESGTYLKIKAKRSYAPVESRNVQKNFCRICYRYAVEGDSYYSDWVTILAADNLASDEVVTGPLLGGNLLATSSYRVEVQAFDDIGNSVPSTIIIPTDKVYWHRDGARNALGLGKYNEKDNALDSAWDFYMNGNKVTGLPTPENATDAIPLGFLRDYIVEQGTSNNWVYRKWSSGLAELWGSGTATRENGYVLSKELSYPLVLTSALCGIGTLNSYGGNTWESLPWNVKLAYGPQNCKIWIHDSGGSFTEDSSLTASVYILGRWK